MPLLSPARPPPFAGYLFSDCFTLVVVPCAVILWMTLSPLVMFDTLLSPLTRDPLMQVLVVLGSLVLFLSGIFLAAFSANSKYADAKDTVFAYGKFVYGCFIKPHSGDATGNQQDALESFYKEQATAYDATRAKLLRGREDMLGLVAAQLKHRKESGALMSKSIWVDVSALLLSNFRASWQTTLTFFQPSRSNRARATSQRDGEKSTR